MGSHLGKPNNSYNLYDNIKHSINELLDEYKFWTNDKICDNLEIFYYDKLIKFKKNDLINASTAIGYKSNENTDKKKICKTIVYHYKNRINLLYKILKSVEINQKKINRANNGPICTLVDGFIDDLYQCNQIQGAKWINKDAYLEKVKKLKSHNKYYLWKDRLNNLDVYYDKNIRELQKIINDIKGDINNSMTDTEYKALVAHTCKILKRFDTLSDIYYLIVINTS